MSRAVLVTRAEPGAARTRKRLSELGYRPIDAATAHATALDAALVLAPGEVIALTSPNGAAAAAELTAQRDVAVFAVGAATARAAREAGFSNVDSADGDGRALAARLLSASPGAVVHVRGRDQGFDLVGALTCGGQTARAVIAYAAEPCDALPVPACLALSAGAAVLIHSPKGAARFAELAHQAGVGGALIFAPVIALAEAAASPLRAAGAQDITLADTPDEDALLAALALRLNR